MRDAVMNKERWKGAVRLPKILVLTKYRLSRTRGGASHTRQAYSGYSIELETWYRAPYRISENCQMRRSREREVAVRPAVVAWQCERGSVSRSGARQCERGSTRRIVCLKKCDEARCRH